MRARVADAEEPFWGNLCRQECGEPRSGRLYGVFPIGSNHSLQDAPRDRQRFEVFEFLVMVLVGGQDIAEPVVGHAAQRYLLGGEIHGEDQLLRRFGRNLSWHEEKLCLSQGEEGKLRVKRSRWKFR